MPVIYPKTKPFRGGFYNNKVVNGINDRVYNAEDMRKPYDTVFTDGIMPEADGTAGDTLKVKLVGDLTISVNPGNAKLGGAWFESTALYNITLASREGAERYDCVILRNDDSDAVRAADIEIRSLKQVPTIKDLTREGGIYEVCLAYIRVPALDGDITIVDTREDGQLCNVMSGVGAMVVRTYRNTITAAKGQKIIPLDPNQLKFQKGRDHLTVIVEGRILSSNAYTIISNTSIELNQELPVDGTKIDFEVIKNVNAAGADTVVQEVGGLLSDMANVNKTLEHHYYCNGQTDNIIIGSLVYAFQVNAANDTPYDDYASMRLVIHGTFGATSPRGGEGTANNPYYWIRAAQGAASNRRVILDFTDCKQIYINCTAGTTNIIFFGMDCQVVGANVNATGGTTTYMFSTAGGTSVYAENCRFWITCESGGFIARSGTFKNCRGSVTNSGLHSYCFVPISASLLRLEGGEYYAYTASKDHVSAIVGLTSGENAVAILYAVNAPISARSGYNQTHSIYQTTGWVSCTDLICDITKMELNVVTGQSNIRGTLSFSKPGLM